jgi:capsular exopolysaccharide synthesis family protein
MDPLRLTKRIAQGVIRRRKGLGCAVLVAALVFFLPVAYYLSKEPPRYRTSSTILLESKPDRIPLFQEFSPFRPLPVQMMILQSRSLAEAVLDNIPRSGLQEVLENEYTVDYWQQVTNAYRRFRGLPPEIESPRQRALKELQESRVRFDVRGRDGIVGIVTEASVPQAAVDLNNTYIEVLLTRTRSFNVDDARVTREFLEQQVGEVKKSLQSSEEALRAFTTGHGGVRIPEQSQATVTQLSQAQSALAEVTASRKTVEARVASIREKVATQERSAPAAPAPPVVPRPVPAAVQRLREQLTKLESALIDLRTKYTDEHPRVILVREQLADVQRELAAAVKETTSATPAPNAVPAAERANFTEQVLALETSLHALVAQEEALRKQVESLRQNLSGLSKSEIEYSRLARDADSNRNLFALLSDRLTGARIREQGEMKVVKVIDPPGWAVVAPNRKRLTFGGIALALAVALGGGIPALVEWRKRPVEEESDVEAWSQLPVLAVVPAMGGQPPLMLTARERRELPNHEQFGDHFLFSEAFRNLRVAVQLASRVEPIRTILVTSAFPGEGKSSVVVNLGIELADAGRRVVLADTDFLRPQLHETLKVRNANGMVDVLHGTRRIVETLVPVGSNGHLMLATRGKAMREDTRGILATSRLGDVMGEMKNESDIVLCDSAPVLLVPDNLFLATAVDAVILVVRAGSTGCRDLAQAKAVLENVGARILGVVLNDMPSSRLKRYYRRYYRHYDAQASLTEAS